MRTQGSGGAIANCSSIGGLIGDPKLASYDATKFGVIGLTRSTALVYAARRIRINDVCPGTINTPRVVRMVAAGTLDLEDSAASTPMGRLGTADEIASVVLWLRSPGANFVTGVALPVNGGYTANSHMTSLSVTARRYIERAPRAGPARRLPDAVMLTTTSSSRTSSVEWLTESRPPSLTWARPSPPESNQPPLDLIDHEHDGAEVASHDRGVRLSTVRARCVARPRPGLPDAQEWSARLALAVVQTLLGQRPVARAIR
jgi:hypothetical protein